MTKYIAVVLSIVAIAIAAVSFTRDVPTQPLGASGDVFSYPVEFGDGVVYSSTYATSTTDTAMTLNWNLIKDKSVIIVTPLTADLTYTLAASSTANFFLPRAGMSQKTCFFNATTTAGVDITFAAGTGVDLEVASSSVTALGSLDIGPSSIGCFTFVRGNASASRFDLVGAYTAFDDAD